MISTTVAPQSALSAGVCKRYVNRLIAQEISSAARYYDALIHWRPLPHDNLDLFEGICAPYKQVARRAESLNLPSDNANVRTMFLLNGNLNHEEDMQAFLTELKQHTTRKSRVVVVAYNPYFQWIYKLCQALGIRKAACPTTFLTRTSARDLARLCGYSPVRLRTVAYCPFRLLGIGDVINAFMPLVPIARWLCFATVITFRPLVREMYLPSVSIIVPARNEKGNIEGLLNRLPDFGNVNVEVIFVEGHSSDGTWDEIQRVSALYSDRLCVKAIQQRGKGKCDAVRQGMATAENDLAIILDADLSVPPEMIKRFYDAYCDGHADFINGCRLLYPTEGNSMPLLNKLGNVFFAKALNMVLGTSFGDTLCGTKLFSRDDYERFRKWRMDFGDFDPFGDFELLFPAALLALGTIDVPIRYKARVYGSTNIRRFRDGFLLLRMTLIGLLRITAGQLGK